MANHKSALKRHRQSVARHARNQNVKSGVKTAVRKVRTAIDGRDAAAAGTALTGAVPALAKAASKGVIHKRTASRKISRLMKAVNTLAAK